VRHVGKNGLILLDQIRRVDRARLVKRSGKVSETTLNATLSVLTEMFTV
jgi:mRNA interferase MazF